MRSSYLDRPTWDPGVFLLAVDSTQGDRWVALAHVTPQGDHGYYNTFTGVRRPYRGRGLAQAMKMQAIHYARGKGALVIRTHNDSSNAPILAVNRKLGYQPEAGYCKMLRRLPG